MGFLKISEGNSKMGGIKSISLPSVVTCIQCACNEKCYSRKLERLRPNVRNAYESNLRLLRENPDVFWREVEAAVMMNRFFRFHVGGDIPDDDYFFRMVGVAARNPHCEILCFTKKYDIVNDFLRIHHELPKNLHIVFSAWIGLEMSNPFLLPEAHVKYRDGTTTALDSAIQCQGNCTECATTNGGCWTLQPGQQIIFDEH